MKKQQIITHILKCKKDKQRAHDKSLSALCAPETCKPGF